MMKFVVLISLVFLLLVPNFGAAQNFHFPANPTVGQEVTGPGGQVYQWDGTKWVHGPTSEVLPINNPTFTGIMTGPTLNLTGSPGLTFNGTGVGGACPAGQFVESLSPTLVPTCMAVASLGDNPIFTGTLTGPNISITGTSTFTGTATFSSRIQANGGINIAAGQTLTFNGISVGGACTAGQYMSALSPSLIPTCSIPSGIIPNGPYQTLQSSAVNTAVWNNYIGIGRAPGGDPLDISVNADGIVQALISNTNPGVNAQSLVVVTNGTGTLTLGIVGTGMTNGGQVGVGNTYLGSNSVGGLDIVEWTGQPIKMWSGGNELGLWDSHSLTMNVNVGINFPASSPVNASPSTLFGWGGSTLNFGGTGVPQTNLTLGLYSVNSWGSWIAAWSGTGQLFQEASNQFNFYMPTNLTGGQPVPVFNDIVYVNTNGLVVNETNVAGAPTLWVNGPIVAQGQPWNEGGTLNCANSVMVINNGVSLGFSSWTGMVLVSELDYTGQTCLWLHGAGWTQLVSAVRPDVPCTANTASPNPGSMGTWWNGSTYQLVNNIGYNSHFTICDFVSRNAP